MLAISEITCLMEYYMDPVICSFKVNDNQPITNFIEVQLQNMPREQEILNINWRYFCISDRINAQAE